MPTALNPTPYSVKGDGEFLFVSSQPDKEKKAKEREGTVGKRHVGNASRIALMVEFDASGWPWQCNLSSLCRGRYATHMNSLILRRRARLENELLRL
jgi:hypothetical protein